MTRVGRLTAHPVTAHVGLMPTPGRAQRDDGAGMPGVRMTLAGDSRGAITGGLAGKARAAGFGEAES